MSQTYNRVATLVLASRTACLQRARDAEHAKSVEAAKFKLDVGDMLKGEAPHHTNADAIELVDQLNMEIA